MRSAARECIERATRSGDRIGVEAGRISSQCLAEEMVRIARLATSIHMAQSARALGAGADDGGLTSPVREMAG